MSHAGRLLALVVAFVSLVGCDPASPPDEAPPPTPTLLATMTPTGSPSLPSPSRTRDAELTSENTTALVARVIDGDTFVLASGERVRLIGINAPESGECYAEEATARLRELVVDGAVILERQVENIDVYDRLLRDVYVEAQFLNEALVREGFALAVSFPPNTEHEAELEAAEEEARSVGAGLWSACQEQVECLSFSELHFNAPGNDNENLNGEWVRITSSCDQGVDFTGWVLRDESATHRFSFPAGFALARGASVTVFTGCGTNTDEALYWCNRGSAIWNNDGDTATLLNSDGKEAASLSY